MSKIEEVAIAIKDNIQAVLPDGVVIDYRYAARAAIEAMREPTLEMLQYGQEGYLMACVSGVSGMTIDAQIRNATARFAQGWRAATDAALNEEVAR